MLVLVQEEYKNRVLHKEYAIARAMHNNTCVECEVRHVETSLMRQNNQHGNHGNKLGNQGNKLGNHGNKYGNHGNKYGNHGDKYGNHGDKLDNHSNHAGKNGYHGNEVDHHGRHHYKNYQTITLETSDSSDSD